MTEFVTRCDPLPISLYYQKKISIFFIFFFHNILTPPSNNDVVRGGVPTSWTCPRSKNNVIFFIKYVSYIHLRRFRSSFFFLFSLLCLVEKLYRPVALR